MISSGNTFERQALMDHFKINVNVDPLTNEEVDSSYVEDNVHLKKSIEGYV